MIPFGDFLYFGLLLYLAVPVVICGVLGVPPRRFILPATLVMVVLQFGLVTDGGWPASTRSIARVLGFVVLQFFVARAFVRMRRAGKRQPVFYTAVLLGLAPLALEKLAPGSRGVVGFLGISYATFRALDVTFAIQDGLVKELSPSEYFSYLVFFPSISAGPIDRFRRFRKDYEAPRSRAQFLQDCDAAVERIFRGMLYAFVLAPLIEKYWLSPARDATSAVGTVAYMYGYSLHLFFDFAGYSAFAIGTGYVLGVHIPENFDRPFWAQNIADFWNRWHITLSTWLRDHIYGRFVMTAAKGKWFADPKVAGYLGSWLAFALMGLWHGLESRYVVYGLYHATLMVGYLMLSQRKGPGRRALPPMLARVVTFHCVCFGFLIFSGRLF
ncbi:MAG TPA: D-alanyl-lipoteichoic acid biosynthesis protein DltB [Gemmatimonadaceae bacterium]